MKVWCRSFDISCTKTYYKNTSGISWLRPNGTVSNFSFCNVKMWTLSDKSFRFSSVSKLKGFDKSGFDLTEVSWVRGEALDLSSFRNLKEFVLKFGDPFNGVEFRVVSLRKLISELHSSRWKLFLRLQNNLVMLVVGKIQHKLDNIH